MCETVRERKCARHETVREGGRERESVSEREREREKVRERDRERKG